MAQPPPTALAGHLWSLVKPRIVALLCLTGLASLFAAGGLPPAQTAAFAVAGATIAAASAALNCWYDRDLDRRMERTADRPLPSGALDGRVALAFAAVLLSVGTAVGLAALPPASVGFMWLGVAAYVGLYTVGLKRRHQLGVVLGGSAGSFPVLAGWTAVRPVEPVALAMAALVFAWTPAHAWALAFVYRDDFAAAGVATLPAVADAATVRRAVWLSAWLAVGVGAVVLALAGPLYAVGLAVAAPPFLAAYRTFHAGGSEPAAVRAFFASNAFLAVVFLAWAADGSVGSAGPAALATVALVAAVPFAWLRRARPSLRGVRASPGPSFGSVPAVGRATGAALERFASIGRAVGGVVSRVRP